jgi:hypothetical protein
VCHADDALLSQPYTVDHGSAILSVELPPRLLMLRLGGEAGQRIEVRQGLRVGVQELDADMAGPSAAIGLDALPDRRWRMAASRPLGALRWNVFSIIA